MTYQPNPGTNPGEGASDTPQVQPDTAAAEPPRFDVIPEPPTPPYEPADAGSNAPAQTVSRDTGTFGGEAPAGRRSNGLRWAIALGGVAVVLAVTIAILVLASGRPSPSIAVGYMPTSTIQYAEYRLDLPGDQRAKMAGFLSKFPGFDDQTIVQTKLYEVFDRIVMLASSNEQSYTADIDPWFGGQIAMGSGVGGQSAAGAMLFGQAMTPFGGDALFVVTVKDQAKASEWLKATVNTGLTEGQHGGTTIYTLGDGSSGSSLLFAVTDKVLLAGSDAAVRAAIDSKGEGKLADDPEFKAAFGTVSRDYVGFNFTEYRNLIQSTMSMFGAGSGLESTTVDDEILKLIPAWQASSLRFENDALVGDGAYPSVQIGYEAKNKKSTLIGRAPAGTILYAESHDVGPAALATIEGFRGLPELQEGFRQADAAVGVVGGFDGVLGWWGDTAVVITKDAAGSIGGGLLIAPTDAAAANRTFETLRSFVVLAGGQAGVTMRDVAHGDATITIVDFSEAVESSGGTVPPGITAELAYSVTEDLVAVGYGEGFVAAALDAGPGPSMADDSRFSSLVKRVGEENIGLSFVDVTAVRDLIEPLVRETLPQDKWALYEREIKPYLLPFDAFISSARIDGAVDRLDQAVTVK
jgi:hypothetical protein